MQTLKKKSYKEFIKLLAHKHKETIDEISAPAFYYYSPQWPAFVLEASEHYQHPARKIVDDLHAYRNSFSFQKDRSSMLELLSSEEEA